MSDLLAALERAEIGDRELDRVFHEANTGECTHRETKHYAFEDGNDYDSGFTCIACGVDMYGNRNKWPAYTTSLDAIVSLIERELPGWDFDFAKRQPGRPQMVRAIAPDLIQPSLMDPWPDRIEASAPTLALALCISFVKAKEAAKPQEPAPNKAEQNKGE